MKVFDIGLEVYYELESGDIVCIEDISNGIVFSVVDKDRVVASGKTSIIFDGLSEIKDIIKDYKNKLKLISTPIIKTEQ